MRQCDFGFSKRSSKLSLFLGTHFASLARDRTDHNIKLDTTVSGFRAHSSSDTVICILFALLGCGGDTGLSDRQGDEGQTGNDGIDSERVATPTRAPDKERR